MQEKLAQISHQQTKTGEPPRVAVVGVGHELNGDDAVGLAVVQGLQAALRLSLYATPHVLIIDAGPAPENFAGCLRGFQPDYVLLIDAVQMCQQAGAMLWCSSDAITGFSASTHTLPLSLLAGYLQREIGCEVVLIGIQPACTDFGLNLSPAVQQAAQTLIAALAQMITSIG